MKLAILLCCVAAACAIKLVDDMKMDIRGTDPYDKRFTTTKEYKDTGGSGTDADDGSSSGTDTGDVYYVGVCCCISMGFSSADTLACASAVMSALAKVVVNVDVAVEAETVAVAKASAFADAQAQAAAAASASAAAVAKAHTDCKTFADAMIAALEDTSNRDAVSAVVAAAEVAAQSFAAAKSVCEAESDAFAAAHAFSKDYDYAYGYAVDEFSVALEESQTLLDIIYGEASASADAHALALSDEAYCGSVKHDYPYYIDLDDPDMFADW